MMTIFRSSLLVLLFCLTLPTLAGSPNQDKPDTKPAQASEGTLPERYLGVFRWDYDMIGQKVLIEFDSVQEEPDGVLIATGKGFYDDTTEIKVKARIDKKNGTIEIWESSPQREDGSSEGFETDGSHKGTISSDFQKVEAVWKTKSSGDTGKLSLRAMP